MSPWRPIPLLCWNGSICSGDGQIVSDFVCQTQEIAMRRIIGWSAASAVAGLVLLAAVAGADEKDKKISLDKAPKAVQDAIKGRFPKAEVASIEKETEGGKVVYDVELKHEGRKYEMDIQENGTVLEIEKEIAAKDLPEAVTKGIEAKYPKATLKEVMEMYTVKGKEE